MRLVWLLGAIAALSGCADIPRELVPPVPPKAAAPELYLSSPPAQFTISAGDRLTINSYFHPALKQSVTVQPDGRVSLLLVGTITVANKTPEQLAKELADAYDEYVEQAEITVTIDESPTLAVYVGGEVARPSILPIRGPLTLLQSIIQAGGFLVSANREQVLILRQTTDGGFHTMQANADRVLRNQADELYLRQRDVVYVPKSAVARAGQFVEQYINQIIPRSVNTVFGFNYSLGGAVGGGTVITPGTATTITTPPATAATSVP